MLFDAALVLPQASAWVVPEAFTWCVMKYCITSYEPECEGMSFDS